MALKLQPEFHDSVDITVRLKERIPRFWRWSRLYRRGISHTETVARNSSKVYRL